MTYFFYIWHFWIDKKFYGGRIYCKLAILEFTLKYDEWGGSIEVILDKSLERFILSPKDIVREKIFCYSIYGDYLFNLYVLFNILCYRFCFSISLINIELFYFALSRLIARICVLLFCYDFLVWTKLPLSFLKASYIVLYIKLDVLNGLSEVFSLSLDFDHQLTAICILYGLFSHFLRMFDKNTKWILFIVDAKTFQAWRGWGFYYVIWSLV